jgi:hypothetical protein
MCTSKIEKKIVDNYQSKYIYYYQRVLFITFTLNTGKSYLVNTVNSAPC